MKDQDNIQEPSHPAMTLFYFKMRLKAFQKKWEPLLRSKNHFKGSKPSLQANMLAIKLQIWLNNVECLMAFIVVLGLFLMEIQVQGD